MIPIARAVCSRGRSSSGVESRNEPEFLRACHTFRAALEISSPMNIHEYQGRELFEKFGVATPPGKSAESWDEAEAVAKSLGGKNLVIKAQIHAGGRGKG